MITGNINGQKRVFDDVASFWEAVEKAAKTGNVQASYTDSATGKTVNYTYGESGESLSCGCDKCSCSEKQEASPKADWKDIIEGNGESLNFGPIASKYGTRDCGEKQEAANDAVMAEFDNLILKNLQTICEKPFVDDVLCDLNTKLNKFKNRGGKSIDNGTAKTIIDENIKTVDSELTKFDNDINHYDKEIDMLEEQIQKLIDVQDEAISKKEDVIDIKKSLNWYKNYLNRVSDAVMNRNRGITGSYDSIADVKDAFAKYFGLKRSDIDGVIDAWSRIGRMIK